MTPLTLAADPDRSIAFIRDVVGYGDFPGETSDVNDLARFSAQMRATVLAWYWPQRGYDDEFDPFPEFEAAARTVGSELELGARLRALVGSRVTGFLVLAAGSAGRTVDETVGAVCWQASCPGHVLLGVLEGTHGLDFFQIQRATWTLGLEFIDPFDESAPLTDWTSATGEARDRIVGTTRSVERLVLELCKGSLARRITRAGGDRDAFVESVEPFEGLLPGLDETFDRQSESQTVARARAAFANQERLADPARFGEVVADLAVGPAGDTHAQTAELIAKLLGDIERDQTTLLTDAFAWVAESVSRLPGDIDEIDQGHGWLLLDRAGLGERVDTALDELDSVGAARAAVRKTLGSPDDRPSSARPGDTYNAPAPGTRYRPLYEALATTEQAAILQVDPVGHRIRTDKGDWISLPSSAVRERTWWSGSGQSSTGRPQVRAWRAAGYGTPRLLTNDEGLVVTVMFPPLDGRDDWLAAHDEEERLERGTYTVPPPPNTPVHGVLTYEGPPVWRMDDEQLAGLRVSFPGSSSSAVTEPAAKETNAPSKNEEGSDAEQIAWLVDRLRQHGETDRRGVEALFASDEVSLSEGLNMAKWLPNLLAKASRQGRIANIGTRKNPRWVAAGTAAHLAARLTRELERNETGERVDKIPAPRLAPGEGVPASLYQDVIRHRFPKFAPEPLPPDTKIADTERGEAYLTDAGLRAVLAGRRLKNQGIKALLYRIELGRDALADAAADAAGAFDRDRTGPDVDVEAIFADA